MKIDVVYGSITPPGRLASAMQAFVATLRQECGIAGDIIDLSELSLPLAGVLAPADLPDETQSAIASIRAADSMVVFSPVFRATAPGALKNLFDLLPVEALENKAVGVIAMGASPHHFLGVDSDLHPILAWFGAITLPAGPYLTSRSFEDGVLTEETHASLGDYARSVADLTLRLQGAVVRPRPLAALARG